MIRRINTGILLLACCATALAQPLYKWIEADGTITFSPDKPPESVDYQLIDIGSDTASNLKRYEDTAIPKISTDNQVEQISKISFSEPRNGDSDTFKRLSASSSSLGANTTFTSSSQFESLPSMAADTQPPTFGSQSAQRLTASTYEASRQHRCDDLRKRVVSLERRMRSKLTPEDMDNTVLSMAKYQRSFDQECVR